MTDSQNTTARTYGLAMCCDCGCEFERKKPFQMFCTGACQRNFHIVMGRRGKVAVPLLQVMRTGKRGKTDDSSFAFKQACLLADQWNTEDKAVGRNPVLVVARKRERAWSAVDVK